MQPNSIYAYLEVQWGSSQIPMWAFHDTKYYMQEGHLIPGIGYLFGVGGEPSQSKVHMLNETMAH